jgi:hypothetical protein
MSRQASPTFDSQDLDCLHELFGDALDEYVAPVLTFNPFESQAKRPRSDSTEDDESTVGEPAGVIEVSSDEEEDIEIVCLGTPVIWERIDGKLTCTVE